MIKILSFIFVIITGLALNVSAADNVESSVGASFGIMFLNTLLVLGVVIALAYLILNKGLKKLLLKTNKGNRIKILESIGLEPKRGLYIIEVDNTEYLLSSSESGIKILDKIKLEIKSDINTEDVKNVE